MRPRRPGTNVAIAPSILACALLACTLGLSGGVARAESEVRYRDGLLWLTADHEPAATVFATVGKRAGIEVVVPDAVAAIPVTLRIRALPLEEALDRLLRAIGGPGHVLVYGRDGRPQRLVVLEDDSAPATPRDRRPPAVHGTATTHGSRPAAIPATADEKQWLRRQIDRWKELNAAERRAVLERVQQLPLQDRMALTAHRRRVLGLPLAQD